MIQLNKILKTFHRTLDQLEQLISDNQRTAQQYTEQIDALHERQGILLNEAAQAVAARDKIKALLGQ